MGDEMILSRIKSSLPSLMREYSYNEFANMFETPSYVTDRAAYYQGARLSDKIAVVFNLANGIYYKFLNGVRILGSDGKGNTVLLAERILPMCCGEYWSEAAGREMAVSVLEDYVVDQCVVMGLRRPSPQEARAVASALVGETVSVTKKLGAVAQSGGSSQNLLR